MWNGERADKEAARVEGVGGGGGGGGGPSRCIYDRSTRRRRIPIYKPAYEIKNL